MASIFCVQVRDEFGITCDLFIILSTQKKVFNSELVLGMHIEYKVTNFDFLFNINFKQM